MAFRYISFLVMIGRVRAKKRKTNAKDLRESKKHKQTTLGSFFGGLLKVGHDQPMQFGIPRYILELGRIA